MMRHAVGSILRTTCHSCACAGGASADVRGMPTSYPCKRRGTTTMKMISSTRTTSTSGVTLISDCRLLPDAPESNCMSSVSLRLGAVAPGDQPDPFETSLLDREHGLTDFS